MSDMLVHVAPVAGVALGVLTFLICWQRIGLKRGRRIYVIRDRRAR
jgi:hypothetical protein